MKTIYAIAIAGTLAITAGFALDMRAQPQIASAAPGIDLPPAAQTQMPAVVELFTSQSCSSCPPADALAEELALRDDVVVISRPVTYWNRIGWIDTLSDERHTELQRAYARRGLAGRNGVYTPQIVVDGRDGVVGSRAGDVSTLVSQALERERPVIDISDDAITITGGAAHRAVLSVVAVDASETVAIGSGENRNRTVTYTNTWLGEAELGEWGGGTAIFAVPEELPEADEADRHALILREESADGAGAILAGRWLG